MKLLMVVLMNCCVVLSVSAQHRLMQLADSIVKYQMESGGWPKNQDWLKGVNQEEVREWRRTGVGSTIDNGATVAEMKALVDGIGKVDEILSSAYERMDTDYLQEKRDAYVEAFHRGVEFLLEMQYDNGGFPQFYPRKQKAHYSSHITFNDNAMVGVLILLRDLADGSERYKCVEVEKSLRKKCLKAYERGLECILDCQIRVDESGTVLEYGTERWLKGKRTVWCQQHDEETLAPTKARAYELPSYSGMGETCAILNLLMDVPNPSEEVKDAVRCGVEWLESHAIANVEVETFVNAEGLRDIRIVEREGAPLLWARYYDLGQAKPMFCDRDGVPRRHLADIGHERRNGYSWIGDAPQKVINRFKNWNYK